MTPYRDDSALLRRYPGLEPALPLLELGTWPTPLEPLSLGERAGARVWVKRDDLSATTYGGNKVRKLELLLADALASGARQVMTFGTAGSNHVLATAIHARRVGLETIGIMTHQANARAVGRNLLAGLAAGSELHAFDSGTAAQAGAREIAAAVAARSGQPPVVVPGGGSSSLGAIGFVEAALELAEQIEAGVMPVPDRLYVALGTMGTAVGLALGLAAAGLPTEVVPVRVVHPGIGNAAGFASLWRNTVARLQRADGDFPAPPEPPDRIRHAFFGEKYGVYTEAGQAAVARAADAGIKLEGTYTGKAFAALLEDLDAGRLAGRNVLFWDTYNSTDLSPLTEGQDWRRLPAAFHRYFTEPYQPLDG